MIFSISEFLGFSDDEVLRILKEENIEITSIHEPREFQRTLLLRGN